jgi:hypothetical protein
VHIVELRIHTDALSTTEDKTEEKSVYDKEVGEGLRKWMKCKPSLHLMPNDPERIQTS